MARTFHVSWSLRGPLLLCALAHDGTPSVRTLAIEVLDDGLGKFDLLAFEGEGGWLPTISRGKRRRLGTFELRDAVPFAERLARAWFDEDCQLGLAFRPGPTPRKPWPGTEYDAGDVTEVGDDDDEPARPATKKEPFR